MSIELSTSSISNPAKIESSSSPDLLCPQITFNFRNFRTLLISRSHTLTNYSTSQVKLKKHHSLKKTYLFINCGSSYKNYCALSRSESKVDYEFYNLTPLGSFMSFKFCFTSLRPPGNGGVHKAKFLR